ncbi:MULTISPECIES: Ldh family oxidoreductase [unclassified Pseudomonas]|uniref:Ldh family oxidoreductase n=1 Tax=unclassified Pseudomonas TaxID=196821 RepID=UPI000B508109|nr:MULTISPECIES: Ldh family oxidoreductase [unclassified Pseudomonas]TFA88600.1 delta1-piperideine-2-carboxylate reductase [Pseudomonas sp. URIL14HWK12:I1]SNB76253.1 delta1-piperideine-2-carboxylate reductase [Pseudomonas sp. LAIL14HWK12:I4]
MAIPSSEPVTHVPFAELKALLESIFERHGCTPAVARVLAANCASAERDGAHSHGVFRMPGYVSTLASGWVDGKATPEVSDLAAGYISVDARGGFAQPALAAAWDVLVAKARAAGIAVLAIHNSHHFAALWPDVEPFAEQGLVALSVVNSMTCVVPHGARKPVFGTNPIAFAAPCEGHPPIVFDMATSAMAHGDVQLAARAGEPVALGVGVDGQGQVTQDPAKILDGGALLPFGEHKGSALSMMVELLAAALTGGHFSWEFDWSGHPGAKTPWTGQLLIVIDPQIAQGQRFAQRSRLLLEQMEAAGVSRMPGARRHLERERAQREGVAIGISTLQALRDLLI